ncbi:MAG: IS1595 family transposase [Bacteroidales bacterium]|jgi:transposase-like protein|nr:IS1595 family transposase [Bacteroidales bacterium]MDP2236445.1 IS1595 family transposase [Bacteroidales bacterium]
MKLTKEDIKSYLLTLPKLELDSLIKELQDFTKTSSLASCKLSRREMLNNKQGSCPHCEHLKYVKLGFDKGAQRYKCKSCKRNFTEYTGTWMAGIHKKNKIDEYMELMLQEKSLDKIKEELKINKKTAFDWRHKILSSIEETDKDSFTGITESDETFLLFSEKGKRTLSRKGRKRGTNSKKRGVSDEQVAVIVTADRTGQRELSVATLGRIRKIDIEKSIGSRICEKTVLCSDSHVSYKGFALDNTLEHHALRADLKQHVKDGVYHVQHVNSMHNRLKKWLNDQFWGVSTKHLQQYMNWFRMKETLKTTAEPQTELAKRTILDVKARARYFEIDDKYKLIISSQN